MKRAPTDETQEEVRRTDDHNSTTSPANDNDFSSNKYLTADDNDDRRLRVLVLPLLNQPIDIKFVCFRGANQKFDNLTAEDIYIMSSCTSRQLSLADELWLTSGGSSSMRPNLAETQRHNRHLYVVDPTEEDTESEFDISDFPSCEFAYRSANHIQTGK